jgi:hypothetical protein
VSARSWWTGVAILTLALLLHAVFPRYAWHSVPGQPTAMVREDRWTGAATWGVVQPATGAWVPLHRQTASDDKVWAEIDRALAGK